MVFIGTVTQALAAENGRLIRVRMRIDRSYKGVSKKALVLFDDGMCNGPDLQIGEQYLMYTRRLGDGGATSRGCTRSRHVKYAAEDLHYLNGLAEATPTVTLLGTVFVRTDGSHGGNPPLSGATVEISGPMGKHTTVTDDRGQYSVGGLEPAEYIVTVNQPGYRMLLSTDQVKPVATPVEAYGCAVVNVALQKNWRGTVFGRVVKSRGEPAPEGMPLDLIRLTAENGEERGDRLAVGGVSTDAKGEYSFRDVAPGSYKIVLNLLMFPTIEAPYPTVYWPTARSESEAMVIEVDDAPAGQQQSYDFRLPPEPASKVVRGIVLSADGKPAPGVPVYISALPDNGIAPNDESHPETDADGNFSFTAFEGFEYRISAFRNLRSPSADTTFSVKDGPQFITLVPRSQ